MLKSYFPRGVPTDFFAFDHLYTEGSRVSRVPVPLYRAIGSRETSNDPSLVNQRTKATGLLQLLPPVWHDWNKIRLKSLPPESTSEEKEAQTVNQQKLLNPQINVAVGSWLMTKIMDMFRRHPGVKIDWNSTNFVELFLFAYHAGLYGTEAAIAALEAEGQPVTMDALVTKAKTITRSTFPYATKDPTMLDRIAVYDRFTAILYEKTRDLKASPKIAESEPVKKAQGPGPGAAIATGMLAAALGVAIFGGRS